MSDELNGIIDQLTKQLEVAERHALESRNDLNVAQETVRRLKKQRQLREGDVRNLANGIRVLTQQSGIQGRPVGRDPQGITERVKTLLADGEEWTGVLLRKALAEHGVTAETNRISSALARLSKTGEVRKIRKGVWVATEKRQT